MQLVCLMQFAGCCSQLPRFARDAGAKPSDQHPPSGTLQPESTLGKKKQNTAERQMLPDREGAAPANSPIPSPMAEPQSMHVDLPPAGPQQARQGGENSKKKRKRLTKAADMLAGSQGVDGEHPAATSLQVRLVIRQYAGLFGDAVLTLISILQSTRL